MTSLPRELAKYRGPRVRRKRIEGFVLRDVGDGDSVRAQVDGGADDQGMNRRAKSSRQGERLQRGIGGFSARMLDQDQDRRHQTTPIL
jgi:hypothetical protein